MSQNELNRTHKSLVTVTVYGTRQKKVGTIVRYGFFKKNIKKKIVRYGGIKA